MGDLLLEFVNTKIEPYKVLTDSQGNPIFNPKCF